jgi:hypothetical protein
MVVVDIEGLLDSLQKNYYLKNESVILLIEIYYSFIKILLTIQYICFKIFHKYMHQNPKQYIPKNTPYCYTITGTYDNGMGVHTKRCPFYHYTKLLPKQLNGHCYLYNATDLDYIALWDQVKMCGINDDDDDDENDNAMN